jgi:hypothetical protein
MFPKYSDYSKESWQTTIGFDWMWKYTHLRHSLTWPLAFWKSFYVVLGFVYDIYTNIRWSHLQLSFLRKWPVQNICNCMQHCIVTFQLFTWYKKILILYLIKYDTSQGASYKLFLILNFCHSECCMLSSG